MAHTYYLIFKMIQITYLQNRNRLIDIETNWWLSRASLVAQRVKCLPSVRETRVQSLDQEDPLEKEMATYSVTLAWKIPWTGKPGRLQSMGLQRVRHDWVTSLLTYGYLRGNMGGGEINQDLGMNIYTLLCIR